MEQPNGDAFYLAAWLVEPALNRISREETVRQLDPRTMQVLICLAARPGEVVKREEIMDKVWGEVIVNENTLSSVVARLRRTLGDDWQNPQYIETISKSGYRLIAPVHRPDVEISVPHGDRLPVMEVPRPAETPSEQDYAPGQRTPSRWPLVGGLVLIAALLGGLWWWSPFSASPPPLPLDPQPLLTLPGPEVGATLSPDGRQVAFTWQGPKQDNWDLYVTVIGDGNPVRMTTDSMPEGFPAWSPDGQSLAFVRADPITRTCTIYQMPVIGGQELRLGECPLGIRSMAWSSDGKYLAMGAMASPAAPQTLVLLDIEKQEQRALTQPANGSQGDRNPVFSPDNKQIAFQRRRGVYSGYDLFVVPVAGGPPRQLTYDSTGSVRGADWTPEGKYLLYSSNRDGEYRLWRLPVTGGEPTRIALNDYGLSVLRHARQANRLIYRTMRDETDLWALRLDENRAVQEPPTTLLSSTREELFPQFSPTGERIAFTSKRTGFYEVWTGDRDGMALIRHTDFKGALVGAPRWSPDGRELIFNASPEGQADLFIVGADSKHPRRFTSEASDEINARFSRDGQWIYYSSNRSGQWKIWKTNRAGTEAIQVTPISGVEAQESQNGQDLYFTRADTLGLWTMPTQGGEATLVISDLSLQDQGNWEVFEDGIYFVQHSTKSIAFYAFATGTITALHTPAKTTSFIGPALTVSPDERLILFGQIEHSEDEIMLVDL